MRSFISNAVVVVRNQRREGLAASKETFTPWFHGPRPGPVVVGVRRMVNDAGEPEVWLCRGLGHSALSFQVVWARIMDCK